jgi:predicted DNA-binding antitoxin AbrB/MazE fold protein
MAKSIKALYENGVFKPLTKVRLKNRQRVQLTVVESKQSSKRLTRSTAKRRRVVVATHPAYRIVGLFKSGLHDLSENHDKYFINSLLRMPREENKVRLL